MFVSSLRKQMAHLTLKVMYFSISPAIDYGEHINTTKPKYRITVPSAGM